MAIRLTSNDVIDNIEMDDTMVDVVAFIDQIAAKTLALNNVHVMRVVVNNSKGRRIQIVAWNKFIPKLEEVCDLSNIIKIEGAVCKYVSSSSRYNDGNVNFQLEIKERTSLKVIGKYTKEVNANQMSTVNFESISRVQGIVQIEGAVKNNFQLLSSKFQNIGLGSITDGEKKLEIHITNFTHNAKIHKGHWIKATGILVKRPEMTPYLNVKTLDDIILVETQPKKSMEYLLAGYNCI